MADASPPLPPVSAPAIAVTGTAAASRAWRVASVVLLFGLLALMLATVRDYGMTADEGVWHRYGRRLLRWYSTWGADATATYQHDTYFYGGFFEIVAELAVSGSPLDPYETRHVVNVLFSIGGLVAVYRMGSFLTGPAGGFLSALLLALTPLYYGHSFANPKDVPFASLFAIALALTLVAGKEAPRMRWGLLLAAGVGIGLAAGVRVAGLVVFGYAAVLWSGSWWLRRAMARDLAGAPRAWADAARLAVGLAAVLGVAWGVMVAFWPFAQVAPLANPFRAFRAFSRFWETMLVYFDGELMRSGDIPRAYVPKWFSLVLPEFYFLALGLGLGRAVVAWRELRLVEALRRAWPYAWLAGVVAAPVTFAVVMRTPLYGGVRHFLFIVPPLAVLAATSVVAWLQGGAGPVTRSVVLAVIGGSLCLTAVDMVQLHPYESVYFNRLVAGGVASAAERYETDSVCSSYREGIEWIVSHHSDSARVEPIRIAGHSVLLQVAYDLRKTEERRRLFVPVSIHDDPHFIVAATAVRDHERTPGRVVHVVERKGAALLYVFEVRPPAHPADAAPR